MPAVVEQARHRSALERRLALALRVVAGFAMVTGLVDVLMGTAILPFLGSALSEVAGADPALDSQFRFLSATWFGYGLALWWVTGDIVARRAMLEILALAMFVGGLGRLVSIAINGLPPASMLVFLAIARSAPAAPPAKSRSPR